MTPEELRKELEQEAEALYLKVEETHHVLEPITDSLSRAADDLYRVLREFPQVKAVLPLIPAFREWVVLKWLLRSKEKLTHAETVAMLMAYWQLHHSILDYKLIIQSQPDEQQGRS